MKPQNQPVHSGQAVSLSEIKSEHTDGVIRRVLSRTSKNNALFRKPGKNEITAPFDFKGSFGAVANLLTAKRLRVNTTHSHADRGLDAYWTPPEATTALLKIESVPRSVADPACGSGAILAVLQAAGHIVHGSDIIGYGWPHTVIRDYLSEPVAMHDVAIVTNPPYRLARKFIEKAIADHCLFHAWLLRLNFLESVGRMALWRAHPPSRVWVSSRRLPMMHRLGWTGRKAPSNHCYAWFIWDESGEKGRLNFLIGRGRNHKTKARGGSETAAG